MRTVDRGEQDRLLRQMRLARNAMGAGAWAEALQLLLASHQDPHTVPPVRDSFVISALADVAKEYAPARAAVLDLRTRLAKAVLDSEPSYDRLNAVLAIDDYFGLGADSYALALALERRDGSEGRLSAELVHVFFAHGDVARARAHLGDARACIRHRLDMENHIAHRHLRHFRSRLDLLHHTAWYRESVALVLDTLHASGEHALADELRMTALDRLANKDMRALLKREALQPGYIESEIAAELESESPNDSDSAQ